jgi:hypothetical protein
MADIRTEGGDSVPLDASGELDPKKKSRNTDTKLRLDGEEDTLYEDGLKINDGDSAPLTGQGGRDDTQNRD